MEPRSPLSPTGSTTLINASPMPEGLIRRMESLSTHKDVLHSVDEIQALENQVATIRATLQKLAILYSDVHSTTAQLVANLMPLTLHVTETEKDFQALKRLSSNIDIPVGARMSKQWESLFNDSATAASEISMHKNLLQQYQAKKAECEKAAKLYQDKYDAVQKSAKGKTPKKSKKLDKLVKDHEAANAALQAVINAVRESSDRLTGLRADLEHSCIPKVLEMFTKYYLDAASVVQEHVQNVEGAKSPTNGKNSKSDARKTSTPLTPRSMSGLTKKASFSTTLNRSSSSLSASKRSSLAANMDIVQWMRVAELQDLLKRHNVPFEDDMNKAQLIKLIQTAVSGASEDQNGEEAKPSS